MDPEVNAGGPEYFPRPHAAPRGGARAGSASRAERIPPASQALLAVLAAGLIGGSLFLSRSGRPTPPAREQAPAQAAAAPVLSAPASFEPRLGLGAAPVREEASPRPLLESPESAAAASAGASLKTAPALPEPPEAEVPSYVPDAAALAALAPEASALPRAAVDSLFNRSAGGFVPYLDQPASRPMFIAGAGRAGPAAAPPTRSAIPANAGACPDCDRAISDSARTNLQVPDGPVVGSIDFVGRCRDGGYIYRVTNRSGPAMPPDVKVIGDDGEVWRTGAIGSGQSVEIRSTAPIGRGAFVRNSGD